MKNNLFYIIKKTALENLAWMAIKNTICEKILVYLSSKPLIRKKLKIGAIAMTYLSLLDKPEYRKADLDKYKIFVNIAEYLGIYLYFFKQNPEDFSAYLVSKLLVNSDTCIDVGANMGSYTLLMASKVGESGKVIAFEPNPNLYPTLMESIFINKIQKFVSVEKLAVSSKYGDNIKFYCSNNLHNSGTSSLINHGVYVNEEDYIVVDTIDLDSYFQKNFIEKCKLIKIDVERAELGVLEGMASILKRQGVAYILIEQLAGSESQHLLESFGYSGWLIDETQKCLVNNKQVSYNFFGNFLFVAPIYLDEFKNKHFDILQS